MRLMKAALRRRSQGCLAECETVLLWGACSTAESSTRGRGRWRSHEEEGSLQRDDSVKTIERASVDSRGRWSEKLITDDSARPGRCRVPVGMLLAQSGDDEMRRVVGRGAVVLPTRCRDEERTTGQRLWLHENIVCGRERETERRRGRRDRPRDCRIGHTA